MTRTNRLMLAALPLLALSMPAEAHRQWMLPSSTVLSGSGDWVTVDAAVSNELFFVDHQPMRLDNVIVTAPDGSAVEIQNKATGKFRSTFDVQLTQPGTYRIANVNNGLNASWAGADGKPVRWRGDKAKFATEVPKDAPGLRVFEMAGRVETFVTEKAPSAIKPTGVGLELVPVTHPNDLVSGEKATFQLVLDGKPAKDLEVEVVPGGIRYRDKLNEMKVKTGADGKFSVTWPNPGMYWISASIGGGREGGPGGMGGPSGMGEGRGPGGEGREGAGRPSAPPPPPGPGSAVPQKRVSYVATLEVMPQ